VRRTEGSHNKRNAHLGASLPEHPAVSAGQDPEDGSADYGANEGGRVLPEAEGGGVGCRFCGCGGVHIHVGVHIHILVSWGGARSRKNGQMGRSTPKETSECEAKEIVKMVC